MIATRVRNQDIYMNGPEHQQQQNKNTQRRVGAAGGFIFLAAEPFVGRLSVSIVYRSLSASRHRGIVARHKPYGVDRGDAGDAVWGYPIILEVLLEVHVGGFAASPSRGK